MLVRKTWGISLQMYRLIRGGDIKLLAASLFKTGMLTKLCKSVNDIRVPTIDRGCSEAAAKDLTSNDVRYHEGTFLGSC